MLESNPLPLLLPASPTQPQTLLLATDPLHPLAFFSLSISSFSGLWEIFVCSPCSVHKSLTGGPLVCLLRLLIQLMPLCHPNILPDSAFLNGEDKHCLLQNSLQLTQGSSLPFLSGGWPEAKEKLGWKMLRDPVHVSSTHSSSRCFF